MATTHENPAEEAGDQTTEALLDGRYRLGPCIGRGGAAIVYRAEDRLLGRTVAVKMLRPDGGEPASGIERAHREASVLAGLNHPSLVTLYDARLAPGHPRYLAMEYVDGPTLATRLTKGALSSQDAAALAHDIARALQTVHAAGVIHRDVKPSNVLLAPPLQAGRAWTAKLTDFGIAHDIDDARCTSPGIIIGTAAYMAPEQVRAEELTSAVDIYSLALVLLEALTGEPAFPHSNGIQTALSRLTNEPAIPEWLSPAWRELLTRMTRSDPAERPSAADIGDAATALVARAPDEIDSTTETREYPAVVTPPPRRSRRRRLRLAALTTAGATLASAAVLSWASWAAPPPENPPAVMMSTPAPTAPSVSPAEPDAQATPVTDGVTARPSDSVAEGDRATASNPSKTASNPNKGPGNNSGKHGKGEGKGKGGPR